MVLTHVSPDLDKPDRGRPKTNWPAPKGQTTIVFRTPPSVSQKLPPALSRPAGRPNPAAASDGFPQTVSKRRQPRQAALS